MPDSDERTLMCIASGACLDSLARWTVLGFLRWKYFLSFWNQLSPLTLFSGVKNALLVLGAYSQCLAFPSGCVGPLHPQRCQPADYAWHHGARCYWPGVFEWCLEPEPGGHGPGGPGRGLEVQVRGLELAARSPEPRARRPGPAAWNLGPWSRRESWHGEQWLAGRPIDHPIDYPTIWRIASFQPLRNRATAGQHLPRCRHVCGSPRRLRS